MVKAWACVAGLLLLGAMPMAAQAPGISEVYARISAEETNNSKIMWIIHEIADVHGPRVTGTPNTSATICTPELVGAATAVLMFASASCPVASVETM